MQVETFIPKEASGETHSRRDMSVKTSWIIILCWTVFLLNLDWSPKITYSSKQITQCLFRKLNSLVLKGLKNFILIESCLSNIVYFSKLSVKHWSLLTHYSFKLVNNALWITCEYLCIFSCIISRAILELVVTNYIGALSCGLIKTSHHKFRVVLVYLCIKKEWL